MTQKQIKSWKKKVLTAYEYGIAFGNIENQGTQLKNLAMAQDINGIADLIFDIEKQLKKIKNSNLAELVLLQETGSI